MDVTNRVALITGGKRLGGEIALALATRGADIALCYRASRAEAQTTADAVLRLGRRVHLVQGDLSKPDDCRRAVSETADRLGRLDILANLASLYAEKPFDELTDEDWDRQLAVDLRAAYHCSKAAAPHMRALGGGRIVNFADWVAASHRPRYTGFVPYYVAKSGVVALTEALALELASDRDPRQCDCAGADSPSAGNDRRRARHRRPGNAARTLGWQRRDRQGSALPRRYRLRHGRNHSCGRGAAPQVGAEGDWLWTFGVGLWAPGDAQSREAEA